MGNKIKGKDLIKLGFPNNNTINIAMGHLSRYGKKSTKEQLLAVASSVLQNPAAYIEDSLWGKIAAALVTPKKIEMQTLKSERVPFEIFGANEIDDATKYQFYDALKLPISVKGALMPDAHYGYGLPIGGVLATLNSVIPYGVGVDIGCSMHLSILDAPASYLKAHTYKLETVLAEHTKFGMKETHQIKGNSPIFENEAFKSIPFLKSLLNKAYQQLGTSGSGNHFVEFGIVKLPTNNPFHVLAGNYIGLLSHSGSRSLGANIAKHYTYLAAKQCPLPKHVQHLAWLDLDCHDGKEYWIAMQLAADYATACHHDIHNRIKRKLGLQSISHISNHHNLAWKEELDGETYIVHRKGATPAHQDCLGIIPGTLTTPAYIVMGKGNEASLHSASHGAGRMYARSICKQKFTKSELLHHLAKHDVTLLGGGIDEAPMAYKDINKVMANQQDLVAIVGEFIPKIARMDQ